MAVTHDEVLRAAQELAKGLHYRDATYTDGLTVIRGFTIQGSERQIESGGNTKIVITPEATFYRVTLTLVPKSGPRRFLEPQHESRTILQKISVFDLGKDNDEILDAFERTIGNFNSF